MSRSKITLLVAVLMLLLIGVGVVVLRPLLSTPRGPVNLQGAWEGTLQIPNVTLRIVFKIQQAPDGSYTATMDSVDQGSADIPVRSLTLSNDTVRVALAQNAAYAGRLNAAATEITGHWQQLGRNFPLVLKRTAHPSTIPAPLPTNAYTLRPDAPLQGYWRGTLNDDGTPIRMAFQIISEAPGQYRGSLNRPDQGARNIPATSVEFVGGTVRVLVESIDGQYEGALKDDGHELEGRWLQGGKDFPLTLKRGTPADDAVPASAYARTNDTELQGHWIGTLGTGRTALRLLLRIARAPDGTYSALLDSLDQGSRDMRATTVTFKDPAVELEWKALRALYHGTLKDGKLTGFWQQGPSDRPLELQRTNPPTAKP